MIRRLFTRLHTWIGDLIDIKLTQLTDLGDDDDA